MKTESEKQGFDEPAKRRPEASGPETSSNLVTEFDDSEYARWRENLKASRLAKQMKDR